MRALGTEAAYGKCALYEGGGGGMPRRLALTFSMISPPSLTTGRTRGMEHQGQQQQQQQQKQAWTELWQQEAMPA